MLYVQPAYNITINDSMKNHLEIIGIFVHMNKSLKILQIEKIIFVSDTLELSYMTKVDFVKN